MHMDVPDCCRLSVQVQRKTITIEKDSSDIEDEQGDGDYDGDYDGEYLEL